MSSNKELHVLKLLAVGTALFYLYKLSKAQGHTLGSNPHTQVKTKNFVNLAAHLLPEEMRPKAREIGMGLMNQWMNS